MTSPPPYIYIYRCLTTTSICSTQRTMSLGDSHSKCVCYLAVFHMSHPHTHTLTHTPFLPHTRPLTHTPTSPTQLLGELLLDRHNFTTMTRYISNPENLKLMMMMLRDRSRNIQFEAFHVFKVPHLTHPTHTSHTPPHTLRCL